jgi:hypothetical protein
VRAARHRKINQRRIMRNATRRVDQAIREVKASGPLDARTAYRIVIDSLAGVLVQDFVSRPSRELKNLMRTRHGRRGRVAAPACSRSEPARGPER